MQIEIDEAAKTAARSCKSAAVQAKKVFDHRGTRAAAKAMAQETADVRARKAAAQELVNKAMAKPQSIFTLENFQDARTYTSVEETWHPGFPSLFTELQGVKAFSENPTCQLMLATFGGQYKKTTAYREKGMYSNPVYEEQGQKKALEDFLATNFRSAASPLKPGLTHKCGLPELIENILDVEWLVGVDAKQKIQGQATRQGFGQLRIQASAKVRLILFSAAKLAVLQNGIADKLSTVISSLSNMTGEQLQAYNAMPDGPVGVQMTLEPWHMAWIPVGSIVFEEALEGNLSFYIRVPFLPWDDLSIKAYESYLSWMKADKKPGLLQMNAVLEHMKLINNESKANDPSSLRGPQQTPESDLYLFVSHQISFVSRRCRSDCAASSVDTQFCFRISVLQLGHCCSHLSVSVRSVSSLCCNCDGRVAS